MQSQRYCGAPLNAVVPESMVHPDLVDEIVEAKRAVAVLMDKAGDLGIPFEDRRFFSFAGAPTKLMMTANARELRHIFGLRCCNCAQWEIRQLADAMLAECRKVAPVLFEHAGAPCQQGRQCPEGAHNCGRPHEK